MAKKTHKVEWKAGKNTHENIIFACFGGMSNTGITAALASMETVKELGLKKVAIGCLGALPTKVGPVGEKVKVARKVVTVDGCPMECAHKIVEEAGLTIVKSIVLVRDIGMKKKALHEDIGGDVKQFMEYIDEENVQKAKELIIRAITKEEVSLGHLTTRSE